MLHPIGTEHRTHGGALEIAARSITESRAVDGIEQVVSHRALDHHFRGLFEYACIRVGPARAAELLSRLAQDNQTPDGFSTEGAPRPWLELYRRVRNSCLQDATGAPDAAGAAAEAVRFWRPREAAYNEQLAHLRHTLKGPVAEAAELHFARGLELSDVAAVMAIDPVQAAAARSQAVAAVHDLLGEHALPSHDRSAAGVLLEAFSLDPRQNPTPPRRPRAAVVRPGDVVAGRYEIDAPLGSGAFADVFRAVDRDVDGHTVALKISRTPCLDERSVHAALRELQLLASVFHPSVVHLKDHGWHDGHLWFVMPLYRGETLAARLRRAPLTRSEARAIFVPLAEALATMHRAGVLHQDIKPDNIFLADIDPREDAATEGEAAGEARRVLPVLLDLGVAAKDAEVVLAGTPAYLAPEVAARFAGFPDPAPVGPKADVFSLALTLRDALEPSVASESPLTSVDAFVSYRARIAPAPVRSTALRDLRGPFTRWLHITPDGRPTAAELCHELSALTAPQERAARRTATLRWSVPTAVALVSLFGSALFGLSREAAQRSLEAADARLAAARAKERAASIYADLTEQQARGKALQASVDRLENEYRQSRLTRDELATRLALAEGEVQALNERLVQQQQRQARLQQELEESHRRHLDHVALLKEGRHNAAQLSAHLQRARQRGELQREELARQVEERKRLEHRLAEVELALERSRQALAERMLRRTITRTSASPARR